MVYRSNNHAQAVPTSYHTSGAAANYASGILPDVNKVARTILTSKARVQAVQPDRDNFYY